MEYFNDFLSRVINLLSEFLFIFNRTLFKIGDSEVSIGTIVIFFASFYLLVIVSKNVRLLLLNKILVRSKLKKSFRESIANGGGLPIGGVVASTNADGSYELDADGNYTSDGTANTVYGFVGDYNNYAGWKNAPNAMHVYDATYIKLRQLSISYSLPSSMFSGKGFQGIDIGIMARNLAILYKKSPHTDPEAGLSAGNIQGYQSGAYPAVRELGLNVTFKF